MKRPRILAGHPSTLRKTAVYGGSIILVAGVFLRYMFRNTYPINGFETTLSERIGDAALADYVRWEYSPADRPSVILSVRGGALWTSRPHRPRRRRKLLRRLRAWASSRRPKDEAADVTTPRAAGANEA